MNALIEMVFEMPEEISGQKNRNVVCQGRVIRSSDVEGGRERRKKARGNDENKDRLDSDHQNSEDQGPEAQGSDASAGVLAASIVDYKFIR